MLTNTTLVSATNPRTVIEAAELALELAFLTSSFAEHSRIPLIAHQTWRSLKSSSWPETVQASVDSWLTAATTGSVANPKMAYIMWDDEGLDQLMEKYEPQMWELFQQLPHPVEKADTFRVTVLRWFGGFYADVDVHLLQHPAHWVQRSDLMAWKDVDISKDNRDALSISPYRHSSSSDAYSVPTTSPDLYQALMSSIAASTSLKADNTIGAIFGLECDTPANRDDHWRMGYSYPTQVTNWALALAPLHPSALAFLSQLSAEIHANITRLSVIDPLDLTGPPALTKSLIAHTSTVEGPLFNWNSITGINDPPGGRGKVVAGDVLVLPITGFSPGRDWFHNMGSMPVTHENARLMHVAQGSWRKTNVRVEAGKLCRTMFGGCRDWKKIP